MDSGISVGFWGVRGSIASPGPHTAGVGGNTSALEVRCGNTTLVLDAGTGIRALGDSLARRGVRELGLLFSHLHWDHIQGLPFFAPAWDPAARIEVVGAASTLAPELGFEGALALQMQPPHFPVRYGDLRARLDARPIERGDALRVGDASVSTCALNHPGGGVGYRIEHGGRSVVYATDHEHGTDLDRALLELASGADVLVYDAMYTRSEHEQGKRGWGHSTWEAAIELADAAKVGLLVLFHHDPQRDDAAVAAIEAQARAARSATIAAREGLVLELGEHEVALRAA